WPPGCGPAWCGRTRSTSSIRRRRSGDTRNPATAGKAVGMGWRPTSMPDAAARSNGAAPARIAVRKTYKLYIGGAFPRSESGRSYVVTGHKGGFLANAALASRKDARDAVAAARKAFGGWSAATAYNRGPGPYRGAE